MWVNCFWVFNKVQFLIEQLTTFYDMSPKYFSKFISLLPHECPTLQPNSWPFLQVCPWALICLAWSNFFQFQSGILSQMSVPQLLHSFFLPLLCSDIHYFSFYSLLHTALHHYSPGQENPLVCLCISLIHIYTYFKKYLWHWRDT